MMNDIESLNLIKGETGARVKYVKRFYEDKNVSEYWRASNGIKIESRISACNHFCLKEQTIGSYDGGKAMEIDYTKRSCFRATKKNVEVITIDEESDNDDNFKEKDLNRAMKEGNISEIENVMIVDGHNEVDTYDTTNLQIKKKPSNNQYECFLSKQPRQKEANISHKAAFESDLNDFIVSDDYFETSFRNREMRFKEKTRRNKIREKTLAENVATKSIFGQQSGLFDLLRRGEVKVKKLKEKTKRKTAIEVGKCNSKRKDDIPRRYTSVKQEKIKNKSTHANTMIKTEPSLFEKIATFCENDHDLHYHLGKYYELE